MQQITINGKNRVLGKKSDVKHLRKEGLVPCVLYGAGLENVIFSVSAKESMTCQYEGVPMSIGFKSSFLIDILNSIPSQEITIKLADPARAGVFVPSVQEENENLLMLLMPMVLND